MRLRAAALGAVASMSLVALVPPALAASPPMRPFPHGQPGGWSYSAPSTDGLRHVVINAAPGLVRVFDTRTKDARDVSVPVGCAMRDATVNFALVGCGDDGRAHFLRLKTAELFPVAGRKDDVVTWTDVGRNWLAGWYDRGRPVDVFLNWRTGAADSFDGFSHPPFDLDAAKLTPYAPQHVVFDRDGAYLLKDVRGSRRTRLVLDRRGGGRVVLSECASGCTRGSLSGGLASWTEGAEVVRAYDIRSGRRFAWRVADPRSFPRFLVGHTRTHVLVGLTRRDPPRAIDLRWARVRK